MGGDAGGEKGCLLGRASRYDRAMTGAIPTELLLPIAVVLAAATLLQWAAGFGMGLFAIPILVLLGLGPEQAIPVVIVAAATQMISGLCRHRHEVEWREVLWMAPFMVTAQPVGVLILGEIATLDKATVRAFFGALLLLVLAAQWWIRPEPRERLHPAWSAAAAMTGGALGGMAGMPGPPLVLWVMAHKWSAWKSRATLWALFIIGIPANLTFLTLRFQWVVPETAATALLFAPVVLLAMLPGTWLGNRIPKPALRRLAVGILLLIGVWALSKPVIG